MNSLDRHPLTAAAFAFQLSALPEVSRTFALTIPQLPGPLRQVVGNAYLLCRIADTIEDEPALPASRKQAFLSQFADVVADRARPGPFADALRPLLSAATIDAEKNLVANTELVVHLTHGFRRAQRDALERCVNVMSAGMAEFADKGWGSGLDSIRDLDRYCYHAAGVVGEMITDLLCDYSAEIALRRESLYGLSSDFGRGLQLVNILKDAREDQRRGVCWLPREAFAAGMDLSSTAAYGGPAFADGVLALVGVAREYLARAMQYTLLIPRRETGVRRFLLWTLGMAILTLRRINANPGFASGNEVKIPRRQVRATAVVTSAAVRSNRVLRWLFDAAAQTLPTHANRDWASRRPSACR